MPLRLVFFGTPAFAVPSLTALAASSHQVVAVVTQPDRPRGRGHKVSASLVKEEAARLAIPVLQPARAKDDAFKEELRAFAPDLGVVAAYGQILPVDLINVPRLGMINVHASLLPRWRGAAPIHRAVLAGDTFTGITIMRVIKALDAGPMLAVAETPIDPHETSGELEGRLAAIGADLIVRTVDAMAAAPGTETPQDESQVTYAARLQRNDARVDFARPAQDVHNLIRGLNPWPLVSAELGGRRLLLLKTEPIASGTDADTRSVPPGTVLRVEPDALVVATLPGAIRLLRVQLEGRPATSVRDYLNGHAVHAGDRLSPWPPIDPSAPTAPATT
jgi:methionyl-tRNA formyltransferase